MLHTESIRHTLAQNLQESNDIDNYIHSVDKLVAS